MSPNNRLERIFDPLAAFAGLDFSALAFDASGRVSWLITARRPV
jgi:hypothetical protein